ncbi:MAG: SDR family oxidoreductase [Chloroflexi bacterium]|nr:SDR family oxidoreductase [Chloroflexota bacterium]
MPRALITGGAGFIGSHLCTRLVEERCDVVCLDSLLTGSQDNIAHLRSNPRFCFIQADVTQPLSVDGPFDWVLHLASPASPRDYARHPIATLLAGSQGTHQALEVAKANGAVFLLASTSEVYGDPEVNPQPESYPGRVSPTGPRSVYDEAKRYAEALTMAYHRSHGLDVRIARIFNTYGPRMQLTDGRVIPNFMTQALQGQPLTVYGDGSQTRSLCYVDDLVDGLYRLLSYRSAGPGAARGEGLIVNLGNEEEVTVRQLADEVIAVTKSKSAVVFEPLPQDDPKQRRPDITRARRLLGWEPRVPRKQGLSKVADYFRAALHQSAGR